MSEEVNVNVDSGDSGDVGGFDYNTTPTVNDAASGLENKLSTDQGTAPATNQPGNGAPQSGWTPENLAAAGAAQTKKYQELAAKEAELEQRLAKTAEIERDFAAAQAVLAHPAMQRTMATNLTDIADSIIRQGQVPPHERETLIRELSQHPAIRQHLQNNPAMPMPTNPAYNPNMYGPPVDPNQIAAKVFEQVQQQMKVQETDQAINNQLMQINEKFRSEIGRDMTEEERRDYINAAVEIGSSPLQHVYNIKNFDKIVADAEARGRAAAMRDLQQGPDPFGAGTLPADDPVAQQTINEILNANA